MMNPGTLTQQLKLARDQLHKKSQFCDRLTAELKRLEAELDTKTSAARESRNLLRSTNAELRAAMHAGDMAQAEHAEEAAALRATADRLRKEMTESHTPSSPSASALVSTASVSPLAPSLGAASAGGAPTTLTVQEVEELRLELARERELHHEAVRLLQASRYRDDEDVEELQKELANAAAGLEQKEEEMLSIHFDMVSLQNNLRDQVNLVNSNAEAFQKASEELADKDNALQQAIQAREELAQQINSVSEQLTSKVNKLTEELHSSRAANQALEEQTRSKVSMLQLDRDGLAAELQRVRAEADAQLAELRLKLQQSEASAEAMKASLAEEFRSALEGDQVATTSPPAQSGSFSSPSRRALAAGSVVAAASAVKVEERLAVLEEKLGCAEAQIDDLKSALERSRLIERQAVERAQEYRTSLELLNEFGVELQLFGVRAPSDDGRMQPISPLGGGVVRTNSEDDGGKEHDRPPLVSEGAASAADAAGEVALRRVLISVELDLGRAGKKTLEVAPWQTRSDFDGIVADFLQHNKVKSIFSEALIAYLQEVEAKAQSFPVYMEGNLSEIHSLYG